MAERLGRYTLERIIGSGGMGDVFLAQGPHGVCVVKRPHATYLGNPEFVRMFLDEARVSAQLHHPGIARIFDLGAVDGAYFIAMEYVPGFDLLTLTLEHERQGEWIAPQLVARIGANVAQALHAAHEAVGADGRPLQVIHRDISPQNILLASSGQLKIIDFGVAKAATTLHKTQAGVLRGKYAYMAPEQFLDTVVDRRVDVYALGLVLYELLTNTRAITGEHDGEVVVNARDGRMRPVEVIRPNVPLGLRDVLARALAKDPNARFSTAAQFQEALEGWLAAERFDVGPEDLKRLFRIISADVSHAATVAESPAAPGGGPPSDDTLMSSNPNLKARVGDSTIREMSPLGAVGLKAALPAGRRLDDDGLPSRQTEPEVPIAGRGTWRLGVVAAGLAAVAAIVTLVWNRGEKEAAPLAPPPQPAAVVPLEEAPNLPLPTPEADAPGHFEMTAWPKPVNVTIDGVEYGSTPVLVELAPGEHAVDAVAHASFDVHQRFTVNIKSGETKKRHWPGKQGELTAVVDPGFARFFINGLPLGGRESSQRTVKVLEGTYQVSAQSKSCKVGPPVEVTVSAAKRAVAKVSTDCSQR